MSTGAECRYYEKQPRQWYYDLQEYPYGATEDFDTQGPFSTFADAQRHLHRNNANPGGYSIRALPGCKHDLLTETEHNRLARPAVCDRCGRGLTPEEVKASGATPSPARED